MGTAELLVDICVVIGLSWTLCRAFASRPFPRVAVTNYRGVKLNPLLGLALGLPAIGVLAWNLASRALAGAWEGRFWQYVAVLSGASIILAAGTLDDLSHGRARGLRGHLRAALRGEFTTGQLKVAAGVGAGLLVVLGLPARSAGIMVAGVVLIAGAANIWNGLDVAPGRAGRPFLVLAALLPFVGGTSAPQAFIFLLFFAALPAVRADLHERGTLGDGGSNLLGFAVGAACYGALDDAGVLIAAGIALALNLVAETVSFSSLIRRNSLLRWFDRLGTSGEWRRFSTERARRTHRL
jgi:UDP-GlcNAc:undecaprenyl-phosphate/decaprenyl-phosphate GlcNAc-1-phosphate transferase